MVLQAQGAYQTNEAKVKLAQANYRRDKNLAKTPNAISQQDLDTYAASEEQASADLITAKANLETAQLNLEFCRVVAPVAGQVSRFYLTVGNLVQQDQTQLTTLVSLDPVYVYFDMDERTVLDVRRLVNEGKITPLRELGSIPISLELPGETGFPHKGKVTFINNQVDPLTGTLTARGVFENPRPRMARG